MAFAKREQLSYSKLLYWDRKFRGLTRKDRRPRRTVDLLPVRVVPDPVATEAPHSVALSVWLANGVSLEIPAGFDAAELQRMLGVLSGC